MKCKICGKETSNKGFGRHLSSHKISANQYFDTFLKEPTDEKCLYCGKPTSFASLSSGYYKFCSISCSRRWNIENRPELAILAGKNISENWKNKSQEEKEAIIEKRVESYKNLPLDKKQEISQRCSEGGKKSWEGISEEEKQTRLENLNTEYLKWFNNLDNDKKQKLVSKRQKSLQKFYEKETQEEKDNRIKQSKENWENKSKAAKLEIANKLSIKSKKAWSTISEDERKIRGKIVSENNLKWWNSASEQEIQKRKENMSIGCKHRKYVNNTISKNEQDLINFLTKHKIEFKFNSYINEKYPFHVDFFIPSQNLFIELNIFWHHGGQPFSASSEECNKQLLEWKEKAKTSKNYAAAIKTWTQRDVQKREIARKNNLNFIECFNEKDIKKLKERILKWD